MLKKILIGAGVLILLFVGFVAYIFLTTRSHSPAAKAEYSGSDGLTITVDYCRPYKKGRLLFGEGEEALNPYGKKWRTGANEATEITLNQDVQIDGQMLEAGTYSLYTIPGEDSWTVAFNSKTDYWGAGMSDPFDESLDVLRADAPVSSSEEEAEQFTIEFADNEPTMHLLWGNTKVSLPIRKG